jgi:hypothetical protein
MIVEIVAPPGLLSAASTELCLDIPVSLVFDDAGLKEAGFGFDA